MRITIHQTAYLPWMGLVSKIAHSDLYVNLNHVQYSKNSFDNRNKIFRGGQEEWLTIPVKTSGKFKNNTLNKVEMANQEWKKAHWDKIRWAYKDTSNKVLLNDLEAFYNRTGKLLFDYSNGSMLLTFKHLDMNIPIKYSSDMKPQKTKSDLVLEICKRKGADEYLAGPFSKDYLDKPSFYKAGIKIFYHYYDLTFHLSAIHYLLTVGKEGTVKMLNDYCNIVEESDYGVVV